MGLIDEILGPENGEGGEKSPSDLMTCAEELIKAIKNDDAEGVVEAFRALLSACDSIDYGEE